MARACTYNVCPYSNALNVYSGSNLSQIRHLPMWATYVEPFSKDTFRGYCMLEIGLPYPVQNDSKSVENVRFVSQSTVA